jgi:hypothetical protein
MVISNGSEGGPRVVRLVVEVVEVLSLSSIESCLVSDTVCTNFAIG